ncbi:MAG: hypothetical protein AABY06_01495 [Nanoarchaeota archaeon]
MDYIKEAFNKVRQDVDFLKNELNNLNKELKENKELMIKICENVQEIFSQRSPAHQQINSVYQENLPADNHLFKPINHENLVISTGNRGVPADRQTDQQTDRQTENNMENAIEMIQSLDNLKKEIYKKFKKLTEQEWLVFSTIYQFDEEKGYSDYSLLAEKLNLTESSIRDYVARLIKKGIPIHKTKLNNKNIRLNISQSLKQIASLSTIFNLRDS